MLFKDEFIKFTGEHYEKHLYVFIDVWTVEKKKEEFVKIYILDWKKGRMDHIASIYYGVSAIFSNILHKHFYNFIAKLFLNYFAESFFKKLTHFYF